MSREDGSYARRLYECKPPSMNWTTKLTILQAVGLIMGFIFGTYAFSSMG